MENKKITDLTVSRFVGVQPEVTEYNSLNQTLPLMTAGNVVLAVSAGLLAMYKHHRVNVVPTVQVAPVYTDALDLQMLNFMRGVVVRYHEIRDSEDEPEKLKGLGFDNHELDFMYKINLANEKYDVKVLESDVVVLKKDQYFTIKCKTREESIKVRQFFKTSSHEIDFDKFMQCINKEVTSLLSLMGEDDDLIPVEKLEEKCDTNFRIKYDTEDDLKTIFKIFNLPPKKKTVRVTYNFVKGILV